MTKKITGTTKKRNVNIQKSYKRKRIAVYKQQMDGNIKNNDIRDQYEFDSDSERYQNRKRRKLYVSSSDEYDTIEIIRNETREKYKTVVFPGENKHLKELEQITLEKSKSNRNKVQSVATSLVKDKENKNNRDNIVLTESRNLNECKEFLQENHQEQCEDDLHDGHLGVNECFGFDENMSVVTPTSPNVNSTMLQNVLAPWRFSEIYVKRNPHFITLKESCLPCISQDMVLDHSIVDQFKHSFKSETKSPVKKAKMSTPKKATVITDYFKSGFENKENSQTSLFDADQLSPIKIRSKSNNKGDSVKRRILGEKDSNIVSSTPNRNLRKSQISGFEDVIDFGFDSSVDESIEGSSPKNKSHDKAFRLSISVNDKKYHRKRRFRKIENAESIVTSDEEGDLSDLESENDKFRLFEDLDTINKNIEREVPLKKKKLKSLNQTPSKQHKKRKDILSKEEEEDAEKWAAAFNSMCEEIQEFPLQIE
ncbi:unnamed protein product [Tenebrio molitor]|jgi:hypothetical protein|nr:unnamed protein product [Tenebrio molitor]